MQWMFAHRSFLDAGIPVPGASDYRPGPFEPLMAIQSMVTRKDYGGVPPRVELGLLGEFLQLRDPRLGGGDHFTVVMPGRERNGPLDLRAQLSEIARDELRLRELGAYGDHAAADVDPDGGGHDGTERRDDRPDGPARDGHRACAPDAGG